MPATSTSLPAPIAGTSHSAVNVVGGKRGAQVQGTIDVSTAGEGGHATIAVLASGPAVGRGRSRHPLLLAHAQLGQLHAGTVVFKLTLGTLARQALVTRGHLAVTVEITIAARGAQTVTLSRRLILRA